MKTVSSRTLRSSSFPLMLLGLIAACAAGSKSDQTGPVAGSSGPSASSQGGAGGSASTPPTAGSFTTGAAGTGMPSSMGTPGGTSGAGGTAGAGTNGGDSGASGSSGGAEAGSMSTADAADVTPTVACNPADKTPDPTPVAFAAPSEGPGLSPNPSGQFKPVMESDPGIPTHTIIRPDPIGQIKNPILAWGEGGCGKSGNIGMFSNLFMEFASHGVLIVADGPADPSGPTMAGTDATPLLAAIDWAQKENERPCSQYYHKLAVDKVAVSGQSCGGLMAEQAATDPRITTAFPYDSGLFSRDQTLYDALHAPMAIFDGGSQDIAYSNGLADFMAITKVPMLFGNPTSCSSNAHVCTFFDTNAGEFGRAGVAWINWWLLDDMGPTGKGMFIGANCGLCDTSVWTLQWNALMPM
jgi:hypothetical protein